MVAVASPPLLVLRSMAYLHVTFERDTDQVGFPEPFVLGSNGKRFRLGPYRGGGGNSSVFEGREIDSRNRNIRTCAVKMQRILTDARRARFQNEVRIHSRVDHIRVASFYGAGHWLPEDRAYEVPWVAMDLGGPNLLRHVNASGPLDVTSFRKVAIQATEAVAALHQLGIIHRDIKPANFVWAYSHETDDIKLIDFGIAKLIDENLEGRKLESYLTQTLEFVGPQNFASPELLRYAQDKRTTVDQRSDLFQLGLLFWFLATGRILSGIPSRRNDPTGGALVELVSHLVREEPEDRPQSAAEVLDRLREIKW